MQPYMCRDHPREYGENAALFMRMIMTKGPSPRIRGECDAVVPCLTNDGTIPANTGRILATGIVVAHVRDHPREYGENPRYPLTWTAGVGPSPRIRGELPGINSFACGIRTIPANTGRIQAEQRLNDLRRDHPREYGENVRVSDHFLPQKGPSPRIRGEYEVFICVVTFHGTIPANTGRIWSSSL